MKSEAVLYIAVGFSFLLSAYLLFNVFSGSIQTPNPYITGNVLLNESDVKIRDILEWEISLSDNKGHGTILLTKDGENIAVESFDLEKINVDGEVNLKDLINFTIAEAGVYQVDVFIVDSGIKIEKEFRVE